MEYFYTLLITIVITSCAYLLYDLSKKGRFKRNKIRIPLLNKIIYRTNSLNNGLNIYIYAGRELCVNILLFFVLSCLIHLDILSIMVIILVFRIILVLFFYRFIYIYKDESE